MPAASDGHTVASDGDGTPAQRIATATLLSNRAAAYLKHIAVIAKAKGKGEGGAPVPPDRLEEQSAHYGEAALKVGNACPLPAFPHAC